MTRWKVAQHVQYRFWLAYPASYDSEQPESNMDDDLPSQPLARGFRKWQDAMAYADRMARTREVVLPRFTALPTERHIYSRGWIIDRLSPGLAVYLEPEHRVPVALAILAREEKEKHRYAR